MPGTPVPTGDREPVALDEASPVVGAARGQDRAVGAHAEAVLGAGGHGDDVPPGRHVALPPVVGSGGQHPPLGGDAEAVPGTGRDRDDVATDVATLIEG